MVRPVRVNTSRPRRIFLVGMMGAGKSSVGAALSELLGWAYRDNDDALREATGRDVAELSVQLGRDRLHAVEADQTLVRASENPPLVVGVAASIAEYPNLWSRLREAGWVVYLRARAETLTTRVGSGTGRPWLKPDPATFIGMTLDVRGSRYENFADLTVDVDSLTPEQVARTIASALPWPSEQ